MDGVSRSGKEGNGRLHLNLQGCDKLTPESLKHIGSNNSVARVVLMSVEEGCNNSVDEC